MDINFSGRKRGVVEFIKKIIREINDDNLFFLAAYLSYNLLLAVFPLIIFLMSLFSLLSLDSNVISSRLSFIFPELIYNFIDEISTVKSAGVLSLSLLLSVNRASAGLKAVMRGVNACYGRGKGYGMIKSAVMSFLMTIVFSLALVTAACIFIFGGMIKNFISGFGESVFFNMLFGLAGNVATLLLIAGIIMIIYRMCLKGKVSMVSLLPGTMFTLVAFYITSSLFGVFIDNFSGLQRVYGSIASVIALMYWLNIISASLLIGAEINSILSDGKEKKGKYL